MVRESKAVSPGRASTAGRQEGDQVTWKSTSQAETYEDVARLDRSDEEQMDDLASVLRSLDEEFAEKERLSHTHAWCTPIPQNRKVSTVEEFYKAFHDMSMLPTHTCVICYCKFGTSELQEVQWNQWIASPIKSPMGHRLSATGAFHRVKRFLGAKTV